MYKHSTINDKKYTHFNTVISLHLCGLRQLVTNYKHWCCQAATEKQDEGSQHL